MKHSIIIRVQIKNLVMNKYLIISFILVLLTSCLNIQKDDDYIILNKIINLENISKNDTLYLLEKGKYNMDCLKYYYIYKYDKKKYDSLFIKFESQKRKNVKYGNLSEKYSKYLKFGFNHVNCVNDSIIDKKTLNYLKNQNDSIFWNKNNINNTNVIIIAHPKKTFKFRPNHKENYPQISISKPIYNKNKDIAIVGYQIFFNNSDLGTNNSRLLIYKKDNNEWQLINKNVNHH